jgi:hypothetical protein
MKRSVFFSLLAISGMISTTAIAAVTATVNITCPVTSGDAVNKLRNFANSYIAGNGIESVDVGAGATTSIAPFKSSGALPVGIPGNLSTYSSASVTFTDTDPSNPFVTCNYTSSNLAFPSFSVVYALLNGFGAEFSSSTTSTITLIMPVGFKS